VKILVDEIGPLPWRSRISVNGAAQHQKAIFVRVAYSAYINLPSRLPEAPACAILRRSGPGTHVSTPAAVAMCRLTVMPRRQAARRQARTPRLSWLGRIIFKGLLGAHAKGKGGAQRHEGDGAQKRQLPVARFVDDEAPHHRADDGGQG
jgi:hypothetical protein